MDWLPEPVVVPADGPAIYHDRYRRTPDGWKFTERLYEVRYLDHSPLVGSAPRPAGGGAR